MITARLTPWILVPKRSGEKWNFAPLVMWSFEACKAAAGRRERSPRQRPSPPRSASFFQRGESLAWREKLFTLRGVTEKNELQISMGAERKLIETSLQKRDSIVIGRGTECDVVIQDLKASRRHCQLTRKDDGFLLEDLASRNGTLVNGVKIAEPILLKGSQTFQIGDTMFYLG